MSTLQKLIFIVFLMLLLGFSSQSWVWAGPRWEDMNRSSYENIKRNAGDICKNVSIYGTVETVETLNDCITMKKNEVENLKKKIADIETNQIPKYEEEKKKKKKRAENEIINVKLVFDNIGAVGRPLLRVPKGLRWLNNRRSAPSAADVFGNIAVRVHPFNRSKYRYPVTDSRGCFCLPASWSGEKITITVLVPMLSSRYQYDDRRTVYAELDSFWTKLKKGSVVEIKMQFSPFHRF